MVTAYSQAPMPLKRLRHFNLLFAIWAMVTRPVQGPCLQLHSSTWMRYQHLDTAATVGDVDAALQCFGGLWDGFQTAAAPSQSACSDGRNLSQKGRLPGATMLWNTVLKAYANAGDTVGADRWFAEMIEARVRPNGKTMGKLIEAAAKAGQPTHQL